MKKFLISIIAFFVVAFVVLGATDFFLSYKIRSNAIFKIKETTSIIVLGSSHSACSFDDRYVAKLENFSRSGESYCYTYIKLKKLVEANPGIKTVIVEFSNPFIYDSEEWLWSDKYIQYHYITFAPFFTFDDNKILFNGHLKSLIGSYPFFVKFAAKKIIKNDYEYAYSYGGHESRNEEITPTDQTSISDMEISRVNLAFLDKIVDYCEKSKVQLVFVRSPLHPDYIYRQIEPQFQQVRKERYGEVPFIDFVDFIEDDEYFADYQHLNQKGSELFSKTVDKILNNIAMDAGSAVSFDKNSLSGKFLNIDADTVD